MSSQNISTQPTAAPAMQMAIEPESGKQNQTRFQSLRLRGGGAGLQPRDALLARFRASFAASAWKAAVIASRRFCAARARYSAEMMTSFLRTFASCIPESRTLDEPDQ
ncbi:unnamed protein product, partial [Rhizoctonia solani]